MMKRDKGFGRAYKICFTQKLDGINYNDFYNNYKNIFNNNNDKIRFIIVGYEKSKEGYEHFQGYIQFKKQMRMKGIKKLLCSDNVHIEKQLGTNTQARNYCWKGQFENKGTKYPQPSAILSYHGEFTAGQGERKDILKVKDLLDKGLTHYDICNEDDKYFQSYGRYHNFFEKYKLWSDNVKYNKCRKELECYILFGHKDTGKTQSILNKYGCKNCYILKDPKRDNKNWNGYESQLVLIIDDFYSWIPFNDILRILDNKPYRVRMLNGYRWAQWIKVFITSNKSPDEWYINIQQDISMSEAVTAFYSRFKECLKVTRGNTNALVTVEKIAMNNGIVRGSFNNYLCLDSSLGN